MNNMVQFSERKRLYIGLLGASLLVVGLFTVAIWYLLFSPERTMFYKPMLLALVAVLVLFSVLATFGLAGIILTIIRARPLAPLRGPMRIVISTFFPLVLGLGKLINIDMDRIKLSFIQVNNDLVCAQSIKIKPHQLLLLAPHCLQNSDCPHKVTGNVDNCHRCGKCGVNHILELRDQYGIKVGMATGGTLARKYVRDYRPRAIVAIACERDLTSGILDANPIPVLGITNLRPNGPCYNTEFSVAQVEGSIRFFLN